LHAQIFFLGSEILGFQTQSKESKAQLDQRPSRSHGRRNEDLFSAIAEGEGVSKVRGLRSRTGGQARLYRREIGEDLFFAPPTLVRKIAAKIMVGGVASD
jgi:hypothetical protein